MTVTETILISIEVHKCCRFQIVKWSLANCRIVCSKTSFVQTQNKWIDSGHLRTVNAFIHPEGFGIAYFCVSVDVWHIQKPVP